MWYNHITLYIVHNKVSVDKILLLSILMRGSESTAMGLVSKHATCMSHAWDEGVHAHSMHIACTHEQQSSQTTKDF